MTSRRTLLATIPALALAACAKTTTPTQLATDAQLVAAGIAVVVPIVLAAKGLTASDAATIQQANASIQSAAQAIVAAAGADVTVSVKTLVAAVQGLAPLALQYLAPGSSYAVAVQAAVALLPVILALSGVSMAVQNAPMPAAQARGVLGAVKR